MSAPVPETYGSAGPWQRYVAKEHAARDHYLRMVQAAHHEYLSTPWPDRESYQHVEQSAWLTYYAAGRDAWRHYVREITPPPLPTAPPTGPYPGRDAAGEAWPADPVRPYLPTFTEYNGGDH